MLNGAKRLFAASRANDDEGVLLAIQEGANPNEKDEMGWNALSSTNSIKVAQTLIDAKADINNQNVIGVTALHRAVTLGLLDMCELLLKSGADMHLTNKRGESPLVKAMNSGNVALIEIFKKYGKKEYFEPIEAKKRIDEKRFEETSCSIFSKPYLRDGLMQFYTQLPSKEKMQLMDTLTEFEKTLSKLDFKDLTDEEKFYYLFFEEVILSGNFQYNQQRGAYPALLDILIESAKHKEFHQSSRVLKSLGYQDDSPFMISMMFAQRMEDKNQRLNFYKKLSKISNVNFNEQNNEWGNTHLHFLISNSDSQSCVDFIRELKSIDSQKYCGLNSNIISTIYGTAPLHLAIAKGYRDKDSEGTSVLDYTILVEELINAGANVNLQTSDFLSKKRGMSGVEKMSEKSLQTPLHIAAARRDFEMIEILVKNGADLNATNAAGLTPLEVFNLPREERKVLVDSISGTNLNNFIEYENTHCNEEHIEKCLELLEPHRKKYRM